jgi:hypothetical protein
VPARGEFSWDSDDPKYTKVCEVCGDTFRRDEYSRGGKRYRGNKSEGFSEKTWAKKKCCSNICKEKHPRWRMGLEKTYDPNDPYYTKACLRCGIPFRRDEKTGIPHHEWDARKYCSRLCKAKRYHPDFEQTVIDLIVTMTEENGEPPTVEQWAADPRRPSSYQTVWRWFGSWADAIEAAGEVPFRKGFISAQASQIVADYLAMSYPSCPPLAEKYGCSPSSILRLLKMQGITPIKFYVHSEESRRKMAYAKARSLPTLIT